ncbi:MAG: hypothetical protein ACM3S5_09820 [Rhodospirillales bacterium]
MADSIALVCYISQYRARISKPRQEAERNLPHGINAAGPNEFAFVQSSPTLVGVHPPVMGIAEFRFFEKLPERICLRRNP